MSQMTFATTTVLLLRNEG